MSHFTDSPDGKPLFDRPIMDRVVMSIIQEYTNHRLHPKVEDIFEIAVNYAVDSGYYVIGDFLKPNVEFYLEKEMLWRKETDKYMSIIAMLDKDISFDDIQSRLNCSLDEIKEAKFFSDNNYDQSKRENPQWIIQLALKCNLGVDEIKQGLGCSDEDISDARDSMKR